MLTTDLEFTEVEVLPVLAAQMEGQCGAEPTAIAAAMETGFAALMAYAGSQHLQCSGFPRAIYTAYGVGGVNFTLALPVAAPPIDAVEDATGKVDIIPGTKAYRFTHHGAYATLMQTYSQITAFLKEKGWMETEADWVRFMPMWEEYVTDPATTPPSDLRTYIYLTAV